MRNFESSISPGTGARPLFNSRKSIYYCTEQSLNPLFKTILPMGFNEDHLKVVYVQPDKLFLFPLTV